MRDYVDSRWGEGRPIWWRFRGVVVFGAVGLSCLMGSPRNPPNLGLCVLFETMALVLLVVQTIRTRRWNRWNRARMTTHDPEPYADLQAAMARLRETEDEAHRQRDSNT